MLFTHTLLPTPSHQYNDTIGLPAVRIAIIDPNRIKGELFLHCSNTLWDAEVVALENSGRAGLAAIARVKPEIILVSAHLADVAPWEFIKELKAKAPKSRAILLMQHHSEYTIHHLGASSYHGIICEMEESMATLGLVIQKVRNGLRIVSAGIAELQNKVRFAQDSFAKLLTDRHFEVLICITQSLSDAEIAAQLGCSPSTALGHRQQIMRKLNIRNTPKLIRFGLEKGFGSVPLPRRASKNPRTLQ